MTNIDYIFLGSSVAMLVFGVPAVLGRVHSVPRHQGWLALSMGAAALLHVFLNSHDVPGETWLQWVGPLLMTFGLLLAWRGKRRDEVDAGQRAAAK